MCFQSRVVHCKKNFFEQEKRKVSPFFLVAFIFDFTFLVRCSDAFFPLSSVHCSISLEPPPELPPILPTPQGPLRTNQTTTPLTMSFNVDVGCDLYGNKVNVELKFNHCPALAELASATETAFDTKARASRPAGYPDHPFKIETFQVFDDTLLRWVDLYDAKQLRPGGQLWCFQPESIWHSDAQGVIPEPEKNVVTFTTPLGSPRRGRIAADAGVPPTLSEKLRSVFYQIDGSNKKYLLFEDLTRAFQQCDMEFTHATAGDLFTMADSNRSNHITYDEWVNFAIKAPSVVDALFFRMRDMYQDRAPMASPNQDAQSARQQELSQMYNQQWAADQRQRQEAEYQAAQQAARDRQARQEQEYQAARDRQARQAREREEAARAAEAQAREAQARAEQLSRQASAADQQAQSAQAQLDQARNAAQQAALAHQQAQSQAQQAAQQQAEAERHASVPRRSYSTSPHPVQHASPGMSNSSPQRDDALRQYENARRKADEIRMMKEEAEREERNAWDKCYYAPSSPHYSAGARGY